MTITASLLNPAFTPLATADVHSTFGLAPRDGVAQIVADNTPALAWGIRGSFYRYVAGATHILDGAKKGPGDYFLWPYQSTKAEGDRLIIQYGGTVNFMKYCGANNELVRGRCDLDFTFADPKIDIDTTTGDIKETQQGHNLRNQIATDTEYDGGGYLFPAPTATLSLSPVMGR